jgi:hypothetical protein
MPLLPAVLLLHQPACLGVPGLALLLVGDTAVLGGNSCAVRGGDSCANCGVAEEEKSTDLAVHLF